MLFSSKHLDKYFKEKKVMHKHHVTVFTRIITAFSCYLHFKLILSYPIRRKLFLSCTWKKKGYLVHAKECTFSSALIFFTSSQLYINIYASKKNL